MFGAFQLCETDVLLLKVVVVPVLPLQLLVEGETALVFHPDVTVLPVFPTLRLKIARAPFRAEVVVHPPLVLAEKAPPPDLLAALIADIVPVFGSRKWLLK